jgi:hypothetical protein
MPPSFMVLARVYSEAIDRLSTKPTSRNLKNFVKAERVLYRSGMSGDRPDENALAFHIGRPRKTK